MPPQNFLRRHMENTGAGICKVWQAQEQYMGAGQHCF